MAINTGAGFTSAEVTAIGNKLLDHYVEKGRLAFNQNVQDKPLLRIMDAAKKTYPGGKEYISISVKGKHGNAGVNDAVAGFAHDDQVNFYNPNNVERANFVWREHHLGVEITETELKGAGILVDDTPGRSPGDKRGMMEVLVPMLGDKFEDLTEQWSDGLQDLLWDDGTSDAAALHGIRALVADNPLTGTVGGINRATAANSWWRNRARTNAYYVANGSAAGPHGGNRVTSSASNGGALLQVLQEEMRQLRRYGGRPNRFLAGSDFISAMETEIRANGNYSDTGFTGRQDGAVGEMMFKGVMVEYDPYLDDLSRSKYAYIFDDRDICLYHLSGDWMRTRTPARPHNQFLFHRSLTATGQLCARRLNSALVIEIA